jgi:hypothetical protein
MINIVHQVENESSCVFDSRKEMYGIEKDPIFFDINIPLDDKVVELQT